MQSAKAWIDEGGKTTFAKQPVLFPAAVVHSAKPHDSAVAVYGGASDCVIKPAGSVVCLDTKRGHTKSSLSPLISTEAEASPMYAGSIGNNNDGRQHSTSNVGSFSRSSFGITEGSLGQRKSHRSQPRSSHVGGCAAPVTPRDSVQQSVDVVCELPAAADKCTLLSLTASNWRWLAPAHGDDLEPVSASEPITTAMIRNIPCKYTREDVIAFLDHAGLKGTYDYVNLPQNAARRANLGYLFVNFLKPADVDLCCRVLSGKLFGNRSASVKYCEVTFARVQVRKGTPIGCVVPVSSDAQIVSSEAKVATQFCGPGPQVPPTAAAPGVVPSLKWELDWQSEQQVVARYSL